MNKGWLLVREQLRKKPIRFLPGIVFNLVGTLFLFLTFCVGLREFLPRIDDIGITEIVFPGIIAAISVIVAYAVAVFDSGRFVQDRQLVDQVGIAGLLPSEIYLGKTIEYWLAGMTHAILSGIFVLVFTGFAIPFSSILSLWLFTAVGLVLVTQIGLILGACVADSKIHVLTISCLLMPLMLMSGFLVPMHSLHGAFWSVFAYFPTALIVDGARSLAVYGDFDYLSLIYLVILDGAAIWICRHFYVRKLVR
ncbi:MAG: ABC transporter permease [Candidatus Neomarinimicrobiota bacterium]